MTNVNKEAKVTEEVKVKKEAAAKKKAAKKEEAVHEVTLQVGHIASGKAHIISFYDKKSGTMLDGAPFKQKPESDYYPFSHHLDLREGKDLEKWQTKFPVLRSKEQLEKDDAYKGITVTSYKEWLSYQFYLLLTSGQLNLTGNNAKGETVILSIQWSGPDMEAPVIKKEKARKTKEHLHTHDLLDGLSF